MRCVFFVLFGGCRVLRGRIPKIFVFSLSISIRLTCPLGHPTVRTCGQRPQVLSLPAADMDEEGCVRQALSDGARPPLGERVSRCLCDNRALIPLPDSPAAPGRLLIAAGADRSCASAVVTEAARVVRGRYGSPRRPLFRVAVVCPPRPGRCSAAALPPAVCQSPPDLRSLLACPCQRWRPLRSKRRG